MSRTVDDAPVAAADGQPGPSLPASSGGLPASRAQQNLDRNICRVPARSEPARMKDINLKVSFCVTSKLTLPTRLSAEPITSNELGRPP